MSFVAPVFKSTISVTKHVSCLLVAGLLCAGEATATPSGRSLTIVAQPLPQALIALAVQSDISISFSDVDLSGKIAPAVEGSMSVENALERLLAETPFWFEKVNASTFRIIKTKSRQRSDNRGTLTIPSQIEEITVTAIKREQVLQAAPYSVGVILGERLGGFGITSASESASLVAGLAVTNQGPGRNKFFVRGLSDGAFSGRTQSAVGLYLDETRLTFNAPDPNLQLIDINRVEVVRGPQGTLYGAGAIGGLVRIITNAPDFNKFEASGGLGGAVTRGGDPSGEVQAVVNSPIYNGRGAVRAVAYVRQDGGYIDDIGIGEANVNDTSTKGFRLGTRWQLSDAWTVGAGFTYQSIYSHDTQYYDGSLQPYTRTNLIAEPHDNDFRAFHVTVKGELGWGELVSSTAWLQHDISNRFDPSLALPTFTSLPGQLSAFDESNSYNTIDHETRVVSEGTGNIEWLAGIFLSHRNEVYDSALTMGQSSLASAVYTEHRTDSGSEVAAFGEVTYYFNERYFLTSGLRTYFGALHAVSVTGPVAAPDAIGRNTKYGVTPKLVVGYKPSDDKLFYGEIAQGFRLGGIDIDNKITTPKVGEKNEVIRTVTNFESDDLWNFELGAKTMWLGQRLTVNTAVYVANWTNIQTDQIRTNGLPFTANVGNARNLGLEIDTAFAATSSLDLSANLTWNRPEVSATNPVFTASDADFLPVVPKLSAGATAQYNVDLPGEYQSYVNVSYAHIGSTRLTFDVNQVSRSAKYNTVSARVGISKENWRSVLYVENIGNNGANTFAFGNPFSLQKISQVTPLRPRTIGLNVSWTY